MSVEQFLDEKLLRLINQKKWGAETALTFITNKIAKTEFFNPAWIYENMSEKMKEKAEKKWLELTKQ